MLYLRSSGILLHPTSLPGCGGIGEPGTAACRFIDWLAAAGQSLWQVLPLGATGYGDSPYASFSAFAGNPLLISLDHLHAEGLLTQEELDSLPEFPQNRVDYGAVIPAKSALLRRAFERWRSGHGENERSEYEQFQIEQAFWLRSFALFMTLKEAHGGIAWHEWEPEFRHREPDALRHFEEEHRRDIEFYTYFQYLFDRQWRELRRYANDRNIRIIGDLPIFVADDSADVWANPHLFQLDEQGMPIVIAGVPPDIFSKTGQRWGNPIYDWERMKAEGFRWWIDRFRHTMRLVDVARVDHFRGFAAYWAIPAEQPTAEVGEWVPAPGDELFEAVHRELGTLPLIAEDLGLITEEVIALRDRFGFWGMKGLQFAFEGGASNPYLPHHHTPNQVVYTGTHDNDTTLGWFENSSPDVQAAVRRYIGCQEEPVNWALVRLAMASVCGWAIFPLQDVLGLGSEARMNRPGSETGWWTWRFEEDRLTPALADQLRELTAVYGRERSFSQVFEL